VTDGAADGRTDGRTTTMTTAGPLLKYTWLKILASSVNWAFSVAGPIRSGTHCHINSDITSVWCWEFQTVFFKKPRSVSTNVTRAHLRLTLSLCAVYIYIYIFTFYLLICLLTTCCSLINAQQIHWTNRSKRSLGPAYLGEEKADRCHIKMSSHEKSVQRKLITDLICFPLMKISPAL